MSDAPIDLGPIATEILYEDDQIRIWDQRLARGEKTAPHRHENDYVLVDVEGERIGVEPLPGHNNRDFDRYLELPVRRGQVYFVEKGSSGELPTFGFSLYSRCA